VTIKSELLDEALKVGNSVGYNWNTIVQESNFFSRVHTQRLLNEFFFLSRVYDIYLKIKMSEMDSKPPKTLAKPYKYPFKKRAEKRERNREEKSRKIFIKNPI